MQTLTNAIGQSNQQGFPSALTDYTKASSVKKLFINRSPALAGRRLTTDRSKP